MREDVTPHPIPGLNFPHVYSLGKSRPHPTKSGWQRHPCCPKLGSLKQTLGQRWVCRSFADVDYKEEGRTWQREKVPCVPEPAPPSLRQPLPAQSWARYFPTAEGNSPATHEKGSWEPGALGLGGGAREATFGGKRRLGSERWGADVPSGSLRRPWVLLYFHKLNTRNKAGRSFM